MPEILAQLPRKLLFLFEPHSYKVIYGGRDGCKSWAAARALLLQGQMRPLRILCTRETQQSIRESVHQLLSEQVKELGLEEFYEVLQYTIRGKNGTEFIFAGLLSASVTQLKSFESIDIAWVEEAQVVSKHSWTVLLPTIRKKGSEIWVTFNPELATDDTYTRWIVNPPPGAVVVQTSYRDNNWLSQESRDKIDFLRKTDPDLFDYVYGGATRSTVEGAIYKAQIAKAEQEKRITKVPYDASLPVQTFWDLGWSDLVCIWFVQCEAFAYRVIDYHEDNYQDSDHYLQVLTAKGYTYSQDPARPAITWPWDASSRMNRATMQDATRKKGFTLRILERESILQGIDATRRLFAQLWFDADKCADGLNGLRRYQWGAPSLDGRLKREPLHDRASHPADALRTMAMSVRVPEKPKTAEPPRLPPRRQYAPFG